MAAEKDVPKWFGLLCEAEDDEFVMNNVEFRLGTNLLHKQLWKIYIEFLRDRNPKEMLHLYSRYCRFFLDDYKMKEKYRAETEKYGRIHVPWKNPFAFEQKFEEGRNAVKTVQNPGNAAVSDSVPALEVADQGPAESTTGDSTLAQNSHSSEEEDEMPAAKVTSKCDFDVFDHQNFSLPRPLIPYILQTADHKILRKLFASCKYFYARKRTPICYALRVSNKFAKDPFNDRLFKKETLYISEKPENLVVVQKFYVSTCVYAVFRPLADPRSFSQLISKLHRCDAKYINLVGPEQSLSLEEFKFLVGHGNVSILNFMGSIVDSENNLIPLEDITALVPKVQELRYVALFLDSEVPLLNCRLKPVRITEKTAEILANQTFVEKILALFLSHISGEPFDPLKFAKFCFVSFPISCIFQI